MGNAALQVIAVDLGASGGRVYLCRLREEGGRRKLSLEEVYRFEHRPVHVPDDSAGGKWSWDVLSIWEHIKSGIAAAAAKVGGEGRVDGIGIDSWGVDYGLVGADGRLVRQPVAYRDLRTEKMMPRVIERLGRSAIYAATGIQFLAFNTIYQLAYDAEDAERPLENASAMLMIPQLLGYWLTGRRVAEHTLASTTQLYDARSRKWIGEFADALGVPQTLLPEVVDAGTKVGTLRPGIAAELGLPAATPVIAVGSHDTASAVVAAPLADDGQSAYLSSGTWSLLGLELPEPCTTEAALAANLTNEAGVSGTTRLLKNLTGMWLVQECRREWAKAGREYSYEQLMKMAAGAKPAEVRIDPNEPEFLAPGDMPARIREACRKSGGELSEEPGAMIRCVLDSLAAGYAELLNVLTQVSGRSIARIHIVGGGGQNQLLNRLAADATGCTVTVGPHDATSIGNALVQAMALGAVSGLSEARQIVRSSFELAQIEPTVAAGR